MVSPVPRKTCLGFFSTSHNTHAYYNLLSRGCCSIMFNLSMWVAVCCWNSYNPMLLLVGCRCCPGPCYLELMHLVPAAEGASLFCQVAFMVHHQLGMLDLSQYPTKFGSFWRVMFQHHCCLEPFCALTFWQPQTEIGSFSSHVSFNHVKPGSHIAHHFHFTTRNSFDLRKAEFPHLLAGVEEWTQGQLHQWPADIVKVKRCTQKNMLVGYSNKSNTWQILQNSNKLKTYVPFSGRGFVFSMSQ